MKEQEIKQQVINRLKPKSEAVWGLIIKAIEKGFNGEIKETDLEIAKRTYEQTCKEDIDKNYYRYMIVEDYNIQNDLYWRFYRDNEVVGEEEGRFADIFEDYFSDVQGWETILLIDMKELKIYQLNKRVEYTSEEMI